jgi:pimeloyl-ACP methyl ester carboxylesterase
MESKFIELESCRLHLFEYQPPRPRGKLVLVHGLGTSCSTWLRIAPELVKDHAVLAVDLPGFGFSELKTGREFCTIEEHGAALATLLDHVAGEPIVLIGHSFGGWISAQYATRRPERVRQLLLIDTAGIYYRGVEALRELFTIDTKANLRRMLNALWYRFPWYFKPFEGAIYRELSRLHMNDIIASIDAEDFLVEELSRLKMPVSVIWGREDRVVSLESLDVLKKFIPRAQVFLIDRCGHVPQLERPRALMLILNRILTEGVYGLD